ncbi:MAG: hypothetical protein PHI31_08510 [Desulfuromonadaceae bacterium]|nr:hypothetical protein [Desulfuromonadaceae bacterium]
MIVSPSILALILSSLIASLMITAAAGYGLQIIRRWDVASGSELQLTLERKTYLISCMVGTVLAAQLLTLFLFITTADKISPLLVGAMCAAGSLKANSFGYPALCAKIAVFVLGAIWLIINHADNLGYDYPLVKPKYLLLLVIAPLSILESALQILYFSGLKPDIITSCCGSQFSDSAQSSLSSLISLPSQPLLIAFFTGGVLALASGLLFFSTGRGALLFSGISVLNFPLTITVTISALSPYIYELPTHHCPFCILQPEYHAIGYLIYLLTLLALVAGMGAGGLSRWSNRESLREKLPPFQHFLAAAALTATTLLMLTVLWLILRSNLVAA